MKRHRVTSHSIPSSSKYGGNGAIDAHVHEPPAYEYDDDDVRRPVRGTIVAVHPWSVLGGGEHNVLGLARRIVLLAAGGVGVGGGGGEERGEGEGGRRRGRRWRVVTFELESDPAWKGGPLWGMMSNHSHEVDQIVEVVNWVRETYHHRRSATSTSSSSSSDGDGEGGAIVLLGSSAGAAMAGTAMARLLLRSSNDDDVDGDGGRKDGTISAYVAIGYTFGNLASIAFGRHYANVVVSTATTTTPSSSSSSSVPRLFVMGERDEFTSVERLERMTTRMRGGGGIVDVELVPDVGHFELERSSCDELVARMVLDWLDRILPA